jgi:hypothetical protein
MKFRILSKNLLADHLPLIVPDDDVCGITVCGITKHYKEGELIVFYDSFPHETWHNGQGTNSGSSKDRVVVLLFDYGLQILLLRKEQQ